MKKIVTTTHAVDKKQGMSPSEILMALHDVNPDAEVTVRTNWSTAIVTIIVTENSQEGNHD